MLIEADLQDAGVDVESGVLDRRSARWLRTRISGLLLKPETRLWRAVNEEKG